MTEAQPVEALASDDRLLALTIRGNRAAFPQLWVRYVASARLFASRLVGPSAAADLVSDAFVTAYREAVEGKIHQDNFRHYIFALIRDKAIENDGGAAATGESLPSVGQESDAIARAFYSMDRRHRAALWFGEVEGLSTSEVALKMNERAAMAVALKVQAKGQFAQLVEEYNGAPISDGGDDLQLAIPQGVTAGGALTRGLNQSPLGVALLRGVVGASPRGWATPGLRELLGGEDGIIAPSGMPSFGDGSSLDFEPMFFHHAPLFAPKVAAALAKPVEAVPSEPDVPPLAQLPIDADLGNASPVTVHDWLRSLNEDFEDDSSALAREASQPLAPQPLAPVQPAEPVELSETAEPGEPVESVEPLDSEFPTGPISTHIEESVEPSFLEQDPENVEESGEPVEVAASLDEDEFADWAEDSTHAHAIAETIEVDFFSSDDLREDRSSHVISTKGNGRDETDEYEDDDWADYRTREKGGWGWLKIALPVVVAGIVLLLLVKCAVDAGGDPTQSPTATVAQTTTAPSPTADESTQEPTESTTEASTEPTVEASTEPTVEATDVAPPVDDVRLIVVTSVDSGPQNICGPKLEGTATSGDTLTIHTGFGDPIQVEVGADGSWAMESNVEVTNPSVRDYAVLVAGQKSPRVQVNVSHSGAPGAWVSVVGDKVKISGSGLLAEMKVQYAVDGVDLGIADTGSGSVDTEFTHALSSGNHVLTARYYQEQGCSGPAASYPFTVF